MKKTCSVLTFLLTSFLLIAQNPDSWYRVYKGKAGNLVTIMHLHKAGKNYSGYVWFEQNQTPMQIYAGYPVPESDSITISSSTSTISFLLTGVFSATGFKGNSQLEKDGVPVKRASFDLQINNEKAYSAFAYFFSEGKDSLPAQYKNFSKIDYFSSAVWPTGSTLSDEALKKFIRQKLNIKIATIETRNWITDEKNKLLKSWKSSNMKMSPKETAELGMSLSHWQEDKILVLHENEKFISIASYNFLEAGGAMHGSFSTTVTTFNKTNNKQLVLTDVLNAQGILILPAILDQVARINFGVKNNRPLDENGFTVKKILPTKNMYVTGTGIGFMYAPYEIKSFADGEINLLVPLTVLKPYLMPGIF